MHRYIRYLITNSFNWKSTIWTFVDIEKSADGYCIQQRKSHYLLILYSTLWHQTISPQFKSILSIRLKKKERTCGVAVIYRICLELFPFGCFALWLLCLTNISILCEGLCESTDKGQGKRICMPLTIIPNTATYLPTLSSLPISFIGFIGSRYLV